MIENHGESLDEISTDKSFVADHHDYCDKGRELTYGDGRQKRRRADLRSVRERPIGMSERARLLGKQPFTYDQAGVEPGIEERFRVAKVPADLELDW